MLKRVGYFYLKFKFLRVILLLLLLHISTLKFITNINSQEFTNSKTLFNHSNRQTNYVLINKIVRKKRKLLKINIAKKINHFFDISKFSSAFNNKFIKFSKLTYLKYDEFLYTYIEFRPPPRFLS